MDRLGGTGRALIAALLLVLLGTLRPGALAFDRFLVGSCWGVPSLWGAVAEVAVRQGAIDPDLGGRRAPFRRASVLASEGSRLAVVVVSDLRRSRVAVIDEAYRVRGAFERLSDDPDLVTDEARGFMPLSHLWPVRDAYGDGRLTTLVALKPTYSEPLAQNVFVFLALGGETNEVLLVCRLGGKRYPGEVVLEQADEDRDGFPDLVVFPYAVRDPNRPEDSDPWAVFRWDPKTRAFAARLREGAESDVAYWQGTPEARAFVGRGEPIDARVRALLEESSTATPTSR